MRYSGIIFDFNGTMFFDTEKNEAAWQKFAESHCGRRITDAEFRERAHGRTNRALLEYLFGHSFSAAEAYELSEKKEVIYREMCLQDVAGFHLAPGLPELLDDLKQREISRTIATAAQKGNLDFYIQHFHLESWFDIRRIIYDNGTFSGKPAPDIYLLAAQQLDLSMERCIVVEDALSGIQAAHAAGAGKIVAVGPEAARESLSRIETVSAVICDFTEFDRSLLGRADNFPVHSTKKSAWRCSARDWTISSSAAWNSCKKQFSTGAG